MVLRLPAHQTTSTIAKNTHENRDGAAHDGGCGETIPIWPRTKAAYNNAIALERITPVASASPNNSLDALPGTSILRVRRQLHSGYLIEIGLAKVATG